MNIASFLEKVVENKNRFIALYLLVMLLFAGIFFVESGKPLMVDETIMVKQPVQMKETGYPSARLMEYPATQVLFPHPPLYLYYQIAMIYAGLQEKDFRLVNLPSLLLIFVMIYFISRELSEKQYRELALLSAFIFALSPLALQGSLIIHIDGLLILLSALIAFFFIKKMNELDLKNILLLGVLFAIVLWAKFSLLLAIPASVFLALLFSKGWKHALSRTIGFGVTGVVLFMASWLAYSSIINFPFFKLFSALLPYVSTSGTNWVDYLLVVAGYGSLRNYVFWLTPALFLMLLMFLFRKSRQFMKTKKLEKIYFPLVYSAAIIINFTLIGHGLWKFPYYILSAMPFISICAAYFLIEEGIEFNKKDALAFASIAAFALLFHLIFLKDPLMPSHDLSDALINAGLYAAPLLFALIITTKFDFRNLLENKKVIAGLFVLFLSTAIYIGVVQLTADYSTLYHYGDKGKMQAAAYIKEHSLPEDNFFGDDDVAYYAERKLFDFSIAEKYGLENCGKAFKEFKIKFVQLRKDYTAKRFPELVECLDRNYKRIELDNFLVYETG